MLNGNIADGGRRQQRGQWIWARRWGRGARELGVERRERGEGRRGSEGRFGGHVDLDGERDACGDGGDGLVEVFCNPTDVTYLLKLEQVDTLLCEGAYKRA